MYELGEVPAAALHAGSTNLKVGTIVQQRNPCKGCVWQERIDEEKIFCPFPHCVKGKLPTGQRKVQSR